MAARAEDLLPVEYFHVVFTLPAEIARIAYWNKQAVYGLLFKASAETTTTIAADPRHLGARIGMTTRSGPHRKFLNGAAVRRRRGDGRILRRAAAARDVGASRARDEIA